MPEKTFRPKQPLVAYTVWYCHYASSCEALIPKVIAEIPDIQELLKDDHGPLTCKSIRKNGCCEILNSGNSFPYVFSSSCFDHIATIEAVNGLISKCRDFAVDYPASVVQVKPGVKWKSVGSLEKSVFLLRSLEPPQILELAQHLTLNRIDFFLPSPKVLVLDLVGVPTATLIRLLHYSEIPIPTSMSQGAFNISFLNFGDSRQDGVSISGQHFKVTCGRISALHSVPMQIRWEDIRTFCEPTIEQSNIQKWLRTEFQGSCPQKVLSINEERTVDWYLHFHVPQKLEATFPKQVCLEGKKILVEHALPFAPVRSSISRPPVEESMHEHWKNSASLAPALKKNRSNCIEHVENCFPSLQRVNMLQEISIKSRGLKFVGSFEVERPPNHLSNLVGCKEERCSTKAQAVASTMVQ